MHAAKVASLAVLLLVPAAAALLFYLQNRDTLVVLFLDLGVAAWGSAALPVPALLLGGAALSFVFGCLFGGRVGHSIARGRNARRAGDSGVEHTL